MVAGWAKRTPPGFTMHVKAFGLMTRHPVQGRGAAGGSARRNAGGRARPRRPAAARAARRGLPAVPSRRSSRFERAGKLGGILFQLPQYIIYKEASLDYLEWARAELGGDEMLVEFRHRSWLDNANRAASLAFLERIGASLRHRRRAPSSETARNLVPDRRRGDGTH